MWRGGRHTLSHLHVVQTNHGDEQAMHEDGRQEEGVGRQVLKLEAEVLPSLIMSALESDATQG